VAAQVLLVLVVSVMPIAAFKLKGILNGI